MTHSSLRVLTLNCWGIPFLTKECNFRLSSIADQLSKTPYDVVTLQEIWTEHHFQEIRSKVKDVFPYSHYFYSGVIGTGLCIFSKFQIIDAFLHQFSINGQFYAIAHGDWFAGKGIGYCKVMHPCGIAHIFNLHFPINGDFYAIHHGDWLAGCGLSSCYIQHAPSHKIIHFFAVHLHADYPSNQYTELRTLQAYHCAQFISKMTRPGDAVILCGDFNHTDTEIGIRSMKAITRLKDSWRTALDKTSGPCYTINTPDNPYGHPNETTKRIDFIFHSDSLTCTKSGLDMEVIPGTNHHYSDHKGVSAEFTFNDCLVSEREADYGTIDEKILRDLFDVISRGFKLAEEYKWKWIVPIWILLLAFIFMPVFSVDGIYVLLPVFSQFSGEVVFFIQLICVVLSVSYFWSLVILKRMEKNAYRNAMNEINLKLANLAN